MLGTLKMYALVGVLVVASGAYGYHKYVVNDLREQIATLQTELEKTEKIVVQERSARELVEAQLRDITEEKLKVAQRVAAAEAQQKKIALELATTKKRLQAAEVPKDCEAIADWLWEEVAR